MYIRQTAAAALAATLLATAPGWATILDTRPVDGSAAGDVVVCMARNVSTVPRTVRIDLLDPAGEVVVGRTYAMTGRSARALVGSGEPTAVSCRFTFPGEARTLRGLAAYYGADDEVLSAVVHAD